MVSLNATFAHILHVSHKYNFPLSEPDGPPQNLNGTALNSTSIYLSWGSPPSEQKNGIVRQYLVNITETETGDEIRLSTADTAITVSGLHPFYHYECIVSAVTIGAGPYTSPLTIQTAPSGMYTLEMLQHQMIII